MDIVFPTSPSIDRGKPVENTSDSGEAPIQPKRVETMTSPTAPRVGGVLDKVPWIGGSNLQAKKNDAPVDVLCFRPESFRECRSNMTP